MMRDVEIFETLQTAVKAAVAASTTPNMGVKFMGRTVAPPKDQKYLEVVLIPNNREGDFWGEEKNYQGIMRLILHWPVDDQGVYTPLNVVKSIASYFFNGQLLSGVQIYAKPNLMGVLEGEGGESLYPVSIRYRSYRAT